MNFLLQWVLYAAAIFLTANILPGIEVSNFTVALIAALVLGVFNAFLRPLLLLLTLPVNILTLGLFTFVVNAALVLLASTVVDGFGVASFWTAFIFAIVLSVISSIFLSVFDEEEPLASSITKHHGV
jgi:putative membrane protein